MTDKKEGGGRLTRRAFFMNEFIHVCLSVMFCSQVCCTVEYGLCMLVTESQDVVWNRNPRLLCNHLSIYLRPCVYLSICLFSVCYLSICLSAMASETVGRGASLRYQTKKCIFYKKRRKNVADSFLHFSGKMPENCM